MRNSPVLTELEGRLQGTGCPVRRVREQVQELADHHEDLRLAALAEGLDERTAAARADAQLGAPEALAEHLAAAWRQASWCGRHPWVSFCLLPPLAFLTLWWLLSAGLTVLGFGLLLLRYGRSFTPADLLAAFARDPDSFAEFYTVVKGLNYLALALSVVGFCQVARRSGAGFRWAWAVCLICSAQGLFVQNALVAHRFTFGYGWPPNWICAIMPILLGCAWTTGQAWYQRRRYPASRLTKTGSAVRYTYPARLWPAPRWLTPTSLATLAALAGLIVYLGWSATENASREVRLRELHSRVWPAERAAVIDHLRAGQQGNTLFETTVDLQPFVNAPLLESLPPEVRVAGNTLAGLPAGRHIFAGVPFLITGRVQLFGGCLADCHQAFPTRVRHIPVARRCRNLHLLQGVALPCESTGASGAVIGRVIVHYADETETSLPLVMGEHLLNVWGPIFTTGVRAERRFTTAPGTELAWVGTNPAIQLAQPENSLRLYRTTLNNPRPGNLITSVDYVSAVTEAAPFLVGLTAE